MRSTRRVSTRITSPDEDSSTVSVPHQFPAVPGAKQPGMVDEFDVSRFVEVRRRPTMHLYYHALGIAGLLFAQACTATANVAYEKQLNEPNTDVCVRHDGNGRLARPTARVRGLLRGRDVLPCCSPRPGGAAEP